MDEEKKQVGVAKFIVPIVAVSIFTLALFGAGYAYFAASVSTNEAANISTQLPNTTTSISTSSSECVMNIAASEMVESKNSTTTPVNLANDPNNNNSCYLAITLSGSTGVKCTYDLVLEETSNTPYRITQVGETPANYTGNEFTGAITAEAGTCSDDQYLNLADCQGASETWTTATGTNAETFTTGITAGNEYQMDSLVGLQGANAPVITDGIIATGTIEVGANDTPVTHYYTLTERWSNIPHDQRVHADALYTYVLKADNIVC